VLRKGLAKMKTQYRLLVLPDHLTPLRIRTHADAPVPFLLYPEEPGSGASYSEREAERSGILIEDGSRMLDLLFRRE
jgi:2,3-bisphosphoglycerate-independent phosphoglycerate mutase